MWDPHNTTDGNIQSKDQQYLLDILIAIKPENCEEDLAVQQPGPCSSQDGGQ